MHLCNVTYSFIFFGRWQSLFAAVSCAAVPIIGKHMCKMTVNDKPITALLVSGSFVTLVKSDVIQPMDFHARKIGIVCVHLSRT